jgi:ABC-type branched-subunit amino acid transport system ATPase component
MLDEPSLGLAPKIVGELFGIIKQLREENMTVLSPQIHPLNFRISQHLPRRA